jgi:hypothetical protein
MQSIFPSIKQFAGKHAELARLIGSRIAIIAVSFIDWLDLPSRRLRTE